VKTKEGNTGKTLSSKRNTDCKNIARKQKHRKVDQTKQIREEISLWSSTMRNLKGNRLTTPSMC